MRPDPSLDRRDRSGFLGRWGRNIARRAKWVLALWALLLVPAGLMAAQLPSVLSGLVLTAPGTEGARTLTLLHRQFPSLPYMDAQVVMEGRSANAVQSLPVRTMLRKLRQRLLETPGVARVEGSSADGTVAPSHWTEHGRLGYVEVVFRPKELSAAQKFVPGMLAAVQSVPAPPTIHRYVTGGPVLGRAGDRLSVLDLERAEILTVPLTLAALVVIFGAGVAAALPLVTGGAGILVSLGALYLLSRVMPLTSTVQDASTMIGLGVGVDYSLFLITRFRERLAAGDRVESAVSATLGSAGRSVAYSGSIVALAFLATLLPDQTDLRSLAAGMTVTVIATLTASLTLLPALLTVLGRNVDALSLPWRRSAKTKDRAAKAWRAWAKFVMRRPGITLFLSLAAMLGLGIPALQIHLWDPSAVVLPKRHPVRLGYEALARGFGPGAQSPVEIVVAGPQSAFSPKMLTAGRRLERELSRRADVRAVVGPPDLVKGTALPLRPLAIHQLAARALSRPGSVPFVGLDGRTSLFVVTSRSGEASASSQQLVIWIRDHAPNLAAFPHGETLHVGGVTAYLYDMIAAVYRVYPWVGLFMALGTFFLLRRLLATPVLPLKAVITNVVSVAGALGALVLVFQDGFGARILGFTSPGAITWITPALLIATLFGLSMDYEVFLLFVIGEYHARGASGRDAVAEGLAETGGLITSAAVLMVTVFLAFGLTGLEFMKEIGIGLAMAVILDAAVVRCVIVPAAMALLGEWNWWQPGRRVPRTTGN